jgi:hypothetical protein
VGRDGEYLRLIWGRRKHYLRKSENNFRSTEVSDYRCGGIAATGRPT